MKELRAELAAVDRQILGLVARRQKLAKSIGQVKDEGELSLRDFAQEKDVIERVRSVAGELGISTEVGERLMRLLIEYSLTAQERQRVAAQGGGGGLHPGSVTCSQHRLLHRPCREWRSGTAARPFVEHDL